ncbi:hypothetical protein UFOVP112_262 [uncultured Caudovirales phage]|uniref:Uncharacterized protein n=1 Tax=uncultured Caudovirales phage TaxID=2100421 RepID=A0A6J5L3W9_9CAUD|nr:hypothetical protein UFOVP112_262 [uncultured Caudovirales phage]
MPNNIPGLYFFQGYSLVDITTTGVIRSANLDSIERNQQRNWETVIQCMGLRAQPHNIQEPVEAMFSDIGIAEFGDFYTGEQRVWTWSWTIEQDGVYDLPDAPLGGLMQDFEQVPVITGLTETAKFMLPIFYPYGTIKNIYFNQVFPS